MPPAGLCARALTAGLCAAIACAAPRAQRAERSPPKPATDKPAPSAIPVTTAPPPPSRPHQLPPQLAANAIHPCPEALALLPFEPGAQPEHTRGFDVMRFANHSSEAADTAVLRWRGDLNRDGVDDVIGYALDSCTAFGCEYFAAAGQPDGCYEIVWGPGDAFEVRARRTRHAGWLELAYVESRDPDPEKLYGVRHNVEHVLRMRGGKYQRVQR